MLKPPLPNAAKFNERVDRRLKTFPVDEQNHPAHAQEVTAAVASEMLDEMHAMLRYLVGKV